MPRRKSSFEKYIVEYNKIKKALEDIQIEESALIASGKTLNDQIICELENQFDTLVDLQSTITRKLMNTPSLTIQHICVKMRVFMEDNGLDFDGFDYMYEGSVKPRGHSATDFSRLLKDLERIAGAETSPSN